MNWHTSMEIRRTEHGWSLYEKGRPPPGSDGLIASANSYDALVLLAKELTSEPIEDATATHP